MAKQTRVRCVILVVVAVISFRSCPWVLELFGRWFLGGSQWVPNFTSVINWTLRVGLAHIGTGDRTQRLLDRDLHLVALVTHPLKLSARRAKASSNRARGTEQKARKAPAFIARATRVGTYPARRPIPPGKVCSSPASARP